VARILRGDVFWADLNPVKGQEQTRRRHDGPQKLHDKNLRSFRDFRAFRGSNTPIGYKMNHEIHEPHENSRTNTCVPLVIFVV